MAQHRTIDLLPEFFRTSTNSQLLAATLDQLTSEPEYKKSSGYVGRRVGPGVGASDSYITEPTPTRRDYQLEPGVVSTIPDTNTVKDAITFPGITDAIGVQGGITNNADRLYTSEYYSWDPFVDLDKMVNFNEYYWLPYGPPAVNIYATGIPLAATYTVTRANGVYTFSGVGGNNPSLNLARGGTYSFRIAQGSTTTTNLLVGNNANNYYFIDYQQNPALTFVRGNTYIFNFNTVGGYYPLYIKTAPSLGTTNVYDNGVYNNGAISGFLRFTVPQDAPDTLYYCCSTQENMRGTITVVDAVSGDGPGFWIQAEAGVSGTMSYAPNISSRDVLGVTDNGTDLGTVTFTVPDKLAQLSYYNMADGGTIDLVSDSIPYGDINGVDVDVFLAQYPRGVDDITNLDGRTIIFTDGSSPDVAVYSAQYVTVGASSVIQLSNVATPPDNTQFFIRFGTQWSQTQWYTNSGWFKTPLLTAIDDTLYYQDGIDPSLFGALNLVEQDNSAAIDVNNIIGKPNYVSPNGVTLTNGLIITFVGNTVPASYSGNTYVVEGVGDSIRLTNTDYLVTPERYNQILPIPFDMNPYDMGPFDAALSSPQVPNYITINRGAPDLNPWSRNNRWFHRDTILASYAYNNIPPYLDEVRRGRRPILEFRGGTRLFDFGTFGLPPVDVIDFTQTAAFANVEGATAYTVDGYNLLDGSRVIFAADDDVDVRNRIYRVEFITPDTIPPLIAQPIINLVPVETVVADNTVVCIWGQTLQGVSFVYDGITWVRSQQKTADQDPPLFNVYDASGVSFGDRVKYQSSTFIGSKLFSYRINNGVIDPVLGFSLTYYSLNNIGDIVFDNNLYTDTFNYISNSVGQVGNVSSGFVRQYSNRTDYVREIGWQTAITRSLDRQQFQFVYDGNPVKLDVRVVDETIVPPLQVYVNNVYVEPHEYTWSTTGDSTTIILTNTYTPGAVIEIDARSDQVSASAFYTVPVNLENNPLNENPPTVTLGSARTHYQSICTNLMNLRGPINGANNTRDLGNIIPYGLKILQQSAPLTLAGYFMRSEQFDVFQAIAYNSREYTKYKTRLLEYVVNNEFGDVGVAQILDQAITDLAVGRTENSPFYWSDMIPWGSDYTLTTYTYTPITGPTFNTVTVHDYDTANYSGLLVFLTTGGVTRMLEKNYEYTVSVDAPQITITLPLNTGDTISIREYSTTVGSYIPNTPSKMGLYPRYRPAQFVDTSYLEPTVVIRGHDGSITVAFDDIRDAVLLEFERRIYNNIKVDGNPIPLVADEVIPGFFRHTDYTRAEVLDILGDDFLAWVGWNKVDYKTQNYVADNPWTYNYSTCGSKLDSAFTVDNVDETAVPGAWRGIYGHYYDTTNPDTRPWEMLGLSEEPSWWKARYTGAPYGAGNFVLWDDLADGYVADPVAPYVNPLYVRPNLQSVIPVGTQGNLLDPLDSVIGLFDPNDWIRSWSVGDGGPVEAAWWTSSNYPFAVMRLLALTRPAKFFSLFADRDKYRFDADLGQYLLDGRYRLNANGIEVYGNGTSKASYINWIVDYNRQLGLDSTSELTTDLQNLNVRLCWRMAGFTDKTYTRVIVESSTPNSNNRGQQLPPESYQLLLYKNQPFGAVTYSSAVIQIAEGGYTVYGYDTINPYFRVFASMSGGSLRTVSAGDETVRVPNQWSTTEVTIPYGYTFTNTAGVVDFILSYGRWLASVGIAFYDVQNGLTMNWEQMASEFLYFAGQGWSVGTIMNLNPSALVFTAAHPDAVVDSIESVIPENMVLDQNRQKFPTRNMNIERLGNGFKITSAAAATISFLRLRWTSYENIMILDNVSIFNDLVYDPVTDSRQSRILVSMWITSEWTGCANARGFIYNQNNITEWQPNRKYTKGQIVKYKNKYYQALTIVAPHAVFDYNDWTLSNYTKIQQGLLANLANKADELATTYDIHRGALDPDMNLLAFGLIGFRPRSYMTALDLDTVSQVNVYQQFLGTKGTKNAIDLFSNAKLSRETSEYSLHENWAVLAGTYGANADRSFVDIRLNEALLTSNPSTIQIVMPGQTSAAEQTVVYNALWSQSEPLRNNNIFPLLDEPLHDAALPSAGYVDVEDVDILVFDLNDPTAVAQRLSTIGIGTTIWAAKSNAYDWNVYRCTGVPGTLNTITDNLNDTAVATFSTQHGLRVGDLFVLRFMSGSVDGVYRVLGVPSPTSIVIAFSFIGTNQTQFTGTGLVFKLVSSRVRQASDIALLPFAQSLIPGATVWCDDRGDGQWAVFRKEQPFVSADNLVQERPVAESLFGSSVCQNSGNFAALVGAPGDETVYAYIRGDGDSTVYRLNTTLEAPCVDVDSWGGAVTCGSGSWSAVGASGSFGGRGLVAVQFQVPALSNYVTTGLLIGAVGQRLGSVVAMSWNSRVLVAGGTAAAEVWGMVEVEEEEVRYVGDNVTTHFNYSDAILINHLFSSQLEILINSASTTDYTITSTDVVFTTAPPSGAEIRIARRSTTKLDQTLYTNVPATGGSGTGAGFNVFSARGVYTVVNTLHGTGYTVGNTLTIAGTLIGGSSPANSVTITVTEVAPGGSITGFTWVGTGYGGTTVFALEPVLFLARTIEAFRVDVGGLLLRPHLDYTFDPLTRVLTFTTVPASGKTITVTTGTYYAHMATLTEGLVTAEYGSSIALTSDARQIVIGAPLATTVVQNGAAFVYDRRVIRFQVVDVAQMVYSVGVSYGPVSVMVNGVWLTDATVNRSGQFAVVGTNVVFTDIVFEVGDNIEVETNVMAMINRLTLGYDYDVARFGASMDLCLDNDTLFVGAPQDGKITVGAGSVTRFVNQSRMYGVTTTTIANPLLLPGDTIRINDIVVTLTGTTVADLVADITATGIPNVVASTTPNLDYVGDGTTTVFAAGSLYTTTTAYTPAVTVNNVAQTYTTDFSYDTSTNSVVFMTAPPPGAAVAIIGGRFTVSVVNRQGGFLPTSAGDSVLTVTPGDGISFDRCGFATFVNVQTIYSPNSSDYAHFGSAVNIDTSSVNLCVAAANGNAYEPTVFDGGRTYYDSHSTVFSDTLVNSGVVYTYDYFASTPGSILNPGLFVFGQQIWDSGLKTGDRFGTAVNYTSGRLLIGAPGADYGDVTDTGSVRVLTNDNNNPSWAMIHYQTPVADTRLITSVYSYNRLVENYQQYYDFINPLQGKILGVAARNIDYRGAVDPAQYNVGTVHNVGNSWGAEHVGEIWWDTDSVRFVVPNQNDLAYESRRWGTIFPGSSVDIYEWIQSDVPPAQYAGPGTPLSTLTYTVNTVLQQQNIFATYYYFWVRGGLTVSGGKTLSTTAIASYIADPRSSGIPYVAVLDASTVAIYNPVDVSATDTVLHIEFSHTFNQDNIHQEFQLIQTGVPTSFVNGTIYRKLLDSFCGVDAGGAAVPDPLLSPGMQYGVQFRPRQSMFVNRFGALQNYIGFANRILIQYPITEMRSFPLLLAHEPVPPQTDGATVIWNKQVATIEELGYQNLTGKPDGYKYLVDSDATQRGLWTIYEVRNETLHLYRIENFDVTRYWSYVNWYAPGYNSASRTMTTVPNYPALAAVPLTVAPIGSSVRVAANSMGKWEIYRRDLPNTWTRVALQDGTVQISDVIWNYALGRFGYDREVYDAQYYDQDPVIETRYIIDSINTELFIDELAIYRNESLVLIFEYIYSEFETPDWLVKTSLIDLSHKIRTLEQYPTFQPDNQTFVLDYVNEVKPYHCVIRDFNIEYDGSDNWVGSVTDFDCPAYWDSTITVPQYISPILLPYTHAMTTVQSDVSDRYSDDQIWLERPWSDWFNNYGLSVMAVTVINGGSGYTVAPTVTISGACTRTAVLQAVINSSGEVQAVIVVDGGSGYVETPVVTIAGGTTVATAYPVMGNGLVRSFTVTMKFDRCQYTSDITTWRSGVFYETGARVRQSDMVWEATVDNTASTFDPDYWTIVPASELSGVDRTRGYYVAGSNQFGLNLPLLIDGIDYPGTQVVGSPYSGGLYATDVEYSSAYRDLYLGTLPADIVVDGAAYMDTYASHAPEELLPGQMFDTVDITVMSRVGQALPGEMWGMPQTVITAAYTPSPISWSSADGVTVIVTNETTGIVLTENLHYTVDWVAKTIAVTGGASTGNVLSIGVWGIGGGSHLFAGQYTTATTTNTVVIPVAFSEIQEAVVFINGSYTVAYTLTSTGTSETTLVLATPLLPTERMSLTVLGPTYDAANVPTNYSWSTALVQTTTTVAGVTTYPLTNSLLWSNPVNFICEVDGARVRGPAAVRYPGDGITTVFNLPTRLGITPSTIPLGDIGVYVGDVLQTGGYTVDDPTAVPRTITFATAPTEPVLVAVTTGSAVTIAGSDLVFATAPAGGLPLSVITWNDTRQQGLSTRVYVGPISTTDTTAEPYDTTGYSYGAVIDGEGSYDYSDTVVITANDLALGTVVTNAERMWVTRNGSRLIYGSDYTLALGSTQSYLLLTNTLGPLDTVIVTLFTDTVVPASASAYRIFSDMRGVTAVYLIPQSRVTPLLLSITATDTVIPVVDVTDLPVPDLANNLWGVVMIGAERVMYRSVNTMTNTLEGCLRGTAGTSALDHVVDTPVQSMSRGELAEPEYQNTITSTTTIGDGITTTFTADFTVATNGEIRVLVGGSATTDYTVDNLSPATVTLTLPPPLGVQVTLWCERANWWTTPR